MMTKEQLAERLNGRSYCNEITTDEEAAAISAGLVVVFGASDDLIEFRGAINDESDCYDCGTVRVNHGGILNQSDARPCFDKMVETIEAYTDPTGLGSEFIDHWKSSQQAASEIPMLDLLHIDGDHVGGIWDDLRLYLPKIKVGGVVAIHDYEAGADAVWPEVAKAVDHHLIEHPFEWSVLPLTGRLFTVRRIQP